MSIQYGLLGDNQIEAFVPLLSENRLMLNEQGVFAVGAVKDGRACGILVFRADELTVDIQYLIVAEDCRRQGIADGLISTLCESAWESGTAVLCSFSAENRNAPVCRLLTKRGDFTLTETEDYVCRFPCQELKEVELDQAPPAGSSIELFYRLPEHMQYSFFGELKKHSAEFARLLQAGKTEMLTPLCLCVVKDGVVQSAIFCQKRNGDVILSFAYARPGHPRALMALVSRLKELLIKAADKVPYLYIAAVTPVSRKLVDTVLPQREITHRFYAASWDMNTMGG